jgi:hypothetical protein
MKKLSGSKLPVEVKGNMSPEGADRVGLLMTIAMVIERLCWRIVIPIFLTGVVLYHAFAHTSVLPLADTNERLWNDAPYTCLIVYEPPTQLIEFKCSRVLGE